MADNIHNLATLREIPNPEPAPSPAAAADESIRDMSAFPIMTEEVGYPPAAISGGPGGASGGRSSSGKNSLGQMAAQAINDVLGWKSSNSDPSAFVGALTQSFSLTEVEGHVQASWVPRSYAVQTDLAGGITGAQASLLFRMKDAVDQSLPLIDGLTPLRRDPDWEYIAAAKAVVKSQLQELIAELSLPGSLRVARVDQIFLLLFAPPIPRKGPGDSQEPLTIELTAPAPISPKIYVDTKLLKNPQLETDPDFVGGQVGEMRMQLGLRTLDYHHSDGRYEPGNLVNTVEDETDQTNYRMVVDYLTSIWVSWLNNRQYFILPTPPDVQPFFGTQLVLISRALSVVAEKVNEVRFTLDSVFIGPAERQALELQFPEKVFGLEGIEEDLPKESMFLEDLLNWVYSFSTEEGPRLIQTAGRYGVKDSFYPVVKSLYSLVSSARNPTAGTVPGLRTARVRFAMDELVRQLQFLGNMARPIKSPMKLPGTRPPTTTAI
jgi:hypothetical protein